jgi:hypothetical protein
MLKKPRIIRVYEVAVLLLGLGLLTTPALALPVRAYGGKVAQLNKGQVELLKGQPGVYYLKTTPERLFNHYVLIELPNEVGGGFLLAKPGDMAAALEEVGAIEKTKTARMATSAPGKETWFVDLYLGGVMSEDGDVDGKASPFGASINDSAKAN